MLRDLGGGGVGLEGWLVGHVLYPLRFDLRGRDGVRGGACEGVGGMFEGAGVWSFEGKVFVIISGEVLEADVRDREWKVGRGREGGRGSARLGRREEGGRERDVTSSVVGWPKIHLDSLSLSPALTRQSEGGA